MSRRNQTSTLVFALTGLPFFRVGGLNFQFFTAATALSAKPLPGGSSFTTRISCVSTSPLSKTTISSRTLAVGIFAFRASGGYSGLGQYRHDGGDGCSARA